MVCYIKLKDNLDNILTDIAGMYQQYLHSWKSCTQSITQVLLLSHIANKFIFRFAFDGHIRSTLTRIGIFLPSALSWLTTRW